jgi:PAS domain S-box-containing protein
MDERLRVILFGWNERARHFVESWRAEEASVEVLGVIDLPLSEGKPPKYLSLPRLEGIQDLQDLGDGLYLLDFRPLGSPKPEGLPPGVVWIPPEGASLVETLCHPFGELLRYKGVVETAQDAVVTIDESHRILFFNRAAEKMFGFSKQEAIGTDLNLIIPPPDRDRHREYVRRYVETRKGRFINHTVEVSGQRRSGEEFPIRISFSVAEEGEHLLMTAVLRDISQIKALEKRALQNERLVSIGQALSYVTHEIKNPLMVIGGFARNLRRCEGIQNEDREHLDIIVKEVQRLEELLAEIQDFTKPLQLEREEIHLGPFLREIIALFGGPTSPPGIELSLDVQGDPVVSADPDRLRQVLLNLTKNAIEAIPQEGVVNVMACEAEEMVTLEVQDSGEGIPPERSEAVFEPFVTTKKGGSGLGLPLCRKIIQDHGGGLTIHSKPKEGTRVRITLPVAAG